MSVSDQRGFVRYIVPNLFRPEQFDDLIKAILGLQDKMLHGAGEEEVKREIASNPYLKGFRELLSQKSLAEIVTILTFLMLILTSFQKAPETPVKAPREFVDAIQNVADELQSFRNDTRTKTLLPTPAELESRDTNPRLRSCFDE